MSLLQNMEKDGLSINVCGYSPHEVTIRTVNNTVIVEGTHEEKDDDRKQISRHFIQKYTFPKHINEVVSSFAPDGILTIKAAPNAATTPEAEMIERVIPINKRWR